MSEPSEIPAEVKPKNQPATVERDARGRAANDPSVNQAGVPEHPQVPPGKPDGEVDTRS
jgi:hypothetical protein